MVSQLSLPPQPTERLPLPQWALRTFRFHLAFAVLDSAAAGILANVPMMALKGLHARDWHLTVPLTIASLGMLAAFPLGVAMSWRRKMPFVLVPGMLFALCSLGMAAAARPLVFLVLAGLGGCFAFMTNPAFAAIMRLNYPVTHRGTVAGIIRRWSALVFMACNLAAARFLDHVVGRERPWIVALMILAGLLSLGAYACFGRIHVRPAPGVPQDSPLPTLRQLIGTLRIVKNDGRFRGYLLGFFLYSFSGLLFAAMITPFLKEQLHCNYTRVALLVEVIPSATSFLVMPSLGAWFDRVNPWLAWAWVRLGWGLDPLILVASTLVWPVLALPLAIAARLARGSVMGGSVVLSWQIGINHFAPPGGDTSRYMGVQILMNGMVRLLAPSAGAIILARAHGSQATVLLVGGAGVLLSAVHAAWHAARERRCPTLRTMTSFEGSFLKVDGAREPAYVQSV